MKKLLCMLLSACLLLALAACGGSDSASTEQTTEPTAESKGLRVGYSKVNITPSQHTDLWGYAQLTGERVFDEVLDYIYLTCVAVTDEQDNTVLFFAADLGHMKDATAGALSASVSAATGIPAENMFFNATHTHSAPSSLDFGNALTNAAVQTAQEALADRKPATMYFGTAETSGISFVRHYYEPNGDVVTDNHGNTAATEFAGHTTEIDEEMRILQFKREGGQDVLLVNWQCHPHMTGGPLKYSLSADIVGAMRTYLEQDGEYLVAYYQGGAGNLNPTSRIKTEEANPDRNYKVTGQYLASTARQALQNMTELEAGTIQVLTETYACEGNKEGLENVANASLVVEYYNAGHTAAETKPYAESLGLYSYYHAKNLTQRSGEDFNVQISVVTIGELAWAIAPGEFFDSTMKYIRDNSPYTYNFSVAYTNGYHGYFPSLEAWEYGCYEVDITPAARGTAEGAAQRLLEMLNELHG